MITYKNISFSAKTFYGVEFKSGEVKSVPGFINSPSMVRVYGVEETKPEKKEVVTKEPVPETKKRKKSSEPEKVSVAEQEIKLEDTTKEELLNGNPS